jgi:hypothetical protein
MSPKKPINEKSAKKTSSSSVTKEKQFSGLTIQKKVNSDGSDFSVITKTTKPKVIVQSECVDNYNTSDLSLCNHKMVKFVCLIVMCIIILITFFLSLKTYNIVTELSNYILN